MQFENDAEKDSEKVFGRDGSAGPGPWWGQGPAFGASFLPPVTETASWPIAPAPAEAGQRIRGSARRRWGLVAGAAGLLVAGVAIGTGIAETGAVHSGDSAASPQISAASQNQSSPAQIAARVDPSVVDITSELTYQGATAEGTGMIISPSGLVLTNNHVVAGATSVSAQSVVSGQKWTVKVIGTDPTSDVALLQLVGASGLHPVSLGDSKTVQIGDTVVAIGNAGGLGGSPTVTAGSVTAMGRTITAGDQGTGLTETLHGLFQIDAPIASGDSGGPLVDSRGQVIGMDTAAEQGVSGSAGSGIGFAIPIDNALSIVKQIEAGTSASTIYLGQPAFLGVEVTNPNQVEGVSGPGGFGGFGGYYSPPPTPGASSGAYVLQVDPRTPASETGLAAGDVIVSLGNKTITSVNGLTAALKPERPGQSVSITWVTPTGQKTTAQVVLGAGPVE
jgi:S1-C subfamily serine protease